MKKIFLTTTAMAALSLLISGCTTNKTLKKEHLPIQGSAYFKPNIVIPKGDNMYIKDELIGIKKLQNNITIKTYQKMEIINSNLLLTTTIYEEEELVYSDTKKIDYTAKCSFPSSVFVKENKEIEIKKHPYITGVLYSISSCSDSESIFLDSDIQYYKPLH